MQKFYLNITVILSATIGWVRSSSCKYFSKWNFSLPLELAIIAFLLFSCSKDEPVKYPQITIISPLENQLFQVFDSIPVEAEITYEKKISQILIRLTDKNFNGILSTINLYPGNANVHVQLNYPVDNLFLDDGEYFLQIRAESNGIYKNKYQKVLIKSVPLKLNEIVVLTQKAGNQIQFSSIDSTQSISELFSINGDFASSEISSANKQIYIAGKNLININAYDLETNKIAWHLEPVPPIPMHSFNCLYYDENLYASSSYLSINGYNSNGSVIFNSSVSETSVPSTIFRFNDFLIVDLQNKTGGPTYLATWYTATGYEKQKLFTQFKVIDFQSVDENRILVFANNKIGDGEIWLYDPSANILTLLKSMSESLISSVKINSSNFLISTADAMFEFIYPQTFMIPVLPGETGLRLKYDELNTMIYIVGPQTIKKIKYPEMIFQKSFTFPDSILNIHLFYNK